MVLHDTSDSRTEFYYRVPGALKCLQVWRLASGSTRRLADRPPTLTDRKQGCNPTWLPLFVGICVHVCCRRTPLLTHLRAASWLCLSRREPGTRTPGIEARCRRSHSAGRSGKRCREQRRWLHLGNGVLKSGERGERKGESRRGERENGVFCSLMRRHDSTLCELQTSCTQH